MFPMGAILLQLFAQLTVASGKLIGAVVVPHGDFAYDPKLVNDTGPPSLQFQQLPLLLVGLAGGSLELHLACERASDDSG